jgi:hypothetical protein
MKVYNSNQLEIEYFFPLTEQIPLDLEYGPTHLHYRAQGIAGAYGMPILGSTYEFTKVPTYTTSINIDSNNIVITSKTKQPLYRRVLYKLLGIKWQCET